MHQKRQQRVRLSKEEKKTSCKKEPLVGDCRISKKTRSSSVKNQDQN